MTVAEVLTGEAPFSHIENDTAVILAVLHNDERPPKIPESLFGVSYRITWDVASACWVKNPAERMSMTPAFQRLRTQASESLPQLAPIVDGEATPDLRSTRSRGGAYQASARSFTYAQRQQPAAAGQSQPLPQRQQFQENELEFETPHLSAREFVAMIRPQQRMRSQPQHGPSPSRTNVQQSLPQQMEQINSGMGQMNMQDPYREPPPVEVKSQPPPPPPPFAGRYGHGPNRSYHGPETAPQQRALMTQREIQRLEREQMECIQQEEQERYSNQRQQQIQQWYQQVQQQQLQKSRPTTYLDTSSEPTLDTYYYGNRPSSGGPPPPPKAYPPQPAAQNDSQYWYAEQQPPATAGSPQPPPQPQQVQRPDDFNFLAVLGKGYTSRKVMLAEEKQTNALYAIKVLKKEIILECGGVENTRSIKNVFLVASQARHPFLLGLHSCFQTETRVYFVMEYVSGGDLMHHIQRKQFSVRQAKFYAQEILLALGYLHSQGIIHRNLMLEHILLNLDGHVKVAGYSLCKEEMWHGCTTRTFCGCAEFMAPEILLELKYGRAVDWWAFGVLLYQMLLGQSPFRGDDEDKIYDAILEDEPYYPITMPRDAASIVRKLLTRDQNRRLGSGASGAEEIKRHLFFKDTNWDDVLNKRIPPPYVPTITSATDTSNFDAEFTREQPILTPVLGQLSAQDQAEFQDFSWTADWAT
ncbi:Serine/threonine kinase [Tulasnella sp. UAMH 9824]|nr:Serine/threonine kinase [Tulasnella sp. UAMH 9824]